jgi:hypothetical protein
VKSPKHKSLRTDAWTLSLLSPRRGVDLLKVAIANVPARDLPFVNALAKLLKAYLNRTR